MRTEITSAADFLVDLVRAHNSSNTLTDVQLQKFRNNVCDCLARHYVDHWFPSTPMKGSGYRCIRINGKMDPLIARAGCMMGLAAAYLRAMFPTELTMWVDPSEVSYRIGENGSICVLYEDKNASKTIPIPQQQQQQHQTPNTPPRTPPPSDVKHSTAVTMLAPPPSSGSPPPLPSHHQTHLQHHHHHQQQQHHHQQHQQHFSPSKSMIQVSTGGHQTLGAGPSPPLSPVSTQQQQAQQQAVAAMQLSMFLPALAHHEKANLAKCKESLRLDATRSMLQDRLFVSSWVQLSTTHVISTTTPTVEKYNQGPSDGSSLL